MIFQVMGSSPGPANMLYPQTRYFVSLVLPYLSTEWGAVGEFHNLSVDRLSVTSWPAAAHLVMRDDCDDFLITE